MHPRRDATIVPWAVGEPVPRGPGPWPGCRTFPRPQVSSRNATDPEMLPCAARCFCSPDSPPAVGGNSGTCAPGWMGRGSSLRRQHCFLSLACSVNLYDPDSFSFWLQFTCLRLAQKQAETCRFFSHLFRLFETVPDGRDHSLMVVLASIRNRGQDSPATSPC
jgi:hypothetical protein